VCHRCVEQDKITELLGVPAGAAPLSNNASYHKKKSLSQLSSFSTSGEYTSDSDQADLTRKFYRKMSSGDIPPAIEPRSEWARRVQCIIECARQKNPMKPGDLPLSLSVSLSLSLSASLCLSLSVSLSLSLCLSLCLCLSLSLSLSLSLCLSLSDLSLSPLTEIKIVWGGEINSSNLDVLRFGVRLVEDSIYGLLSLSLPPSLISPSPRLHVLCGLSL
jgi:hypothetical protein